jgi:hypothetical protein
MITDAATPASPALTRPAATPNAQVRSPSIDYAMALTAYQASALPQRVTTRPALSHQLDRNSVGRTHQISAQI